MWNNFIMHVLQLLQSYYNFTDFFTLQNYNSFLYPVAEPSNSMTFGITFCKCPMYLLHFAWSTVPQNCSIPSISSSLVLGLISRRMYSLSSCHRFSMRLRSGDSAGVFHQLTDLFCSHCLSCLMSALGRYHAWIYAPPDRPTQWMAAVSSQGCR